MIFQYNRLLSILIVLINVFFEDVITGDPGDVEKYLQSGTRLLAAGQLVDALAQYDKAVEGDPNNYLIYYRRATAYLGMGKTKSAIEDLTSSLTLNPGFIPARSQRSNLYLKQGRLKEAKEDLDIIVKQKPDDAEFLKSLATIGELADAIESAKTYYENVNYEEAIKYLNIAIETTTLSQSLREMRANCFLKTGETQKAILDFRHSVKLSTDDRGGILKLSQLLYEIGSAEQSLTEIRECLKLDPDHKECFAHYKKIKKLVQLINSIQNAMNANGFEECITKSIKLISSEPLYSLTGNQYLCTCQVKGGDPKAAVNTCESVHNSDPTNIDIICDLADAHVANENYDSAISYFQKALNSDQNFKRAKDGIKKAQNLLKISKKRNYYKILGVSRSASKKDILRAYRKLAAEYHPDKYKGESKAAAERKFIDISDAKEVLSNAEKREKYDNGEDPLDPEQQHQGPSGGPFGGFTFHNFNPFENNGGGQQYEFHFG